MCSLYLLGTEHAHENTDYFHLWRNAEDDCLEQMNADQADRDGDGAGDVCDAMPETPNHVLIRQSFMQTGEVVTGDRYRLRGTLSSGAHMLIGNNYMLIGALKP